MEHSKRKRELLTEYLAGRITREEMDEEVRILNGTLLAWKRQDGTYRWWDPDGVEHTGDEAALDKVGEKYALVIIDDILPDIAPITDENDIQTDI